MAALASQRFERAQEACEQLSKRFPRRAASQLLAGHIGKALGNRDEARAAYDASLAMDPASTEAIYNRIDLDPPSPDDALALRVQSLLNEPGLGDAELANLSFARARILEAARQYEEAFEHYEQANAAAARMMARSGHRVSAGGGGGLAGTHPRLLCEALSHAPSSRWRSTCGPYSSSACRARAPPWWSRFSPAIRGSRRAVSCRSPPTASRPTFAAVKSRA